MSPDLIAADLAFPVILYGKHIVSGIVTESALTAHDILELLAAQMVLMNSKTCFEILIYNQSDVKARGDKDASIWYQKTGRSWAININN